MPDSKGLLFKVSALIASFLLSTCTKYSRCYLYQILLVAASRLFLREIEERIQQREDFAFETTLAGRTYLRLIKRLHCEGWRVELAYLALLSVGMSKLRVAERVAHGGHNIPLRDIERRFSRSLNNLLNNFSHVVDRCSCFMNDGETPVLVFEQNGDNRDILHVVYYQLLQESVI
ncbi:MAG: hypothetical protein PF441_05660 [Desulfuromusa sp.]|jgi:predicted ABC-type ATPase|nr:hypothetical protein [Desulfuromusa sp.]